MANTCTTEYMFEGEGAQIRALHSALDKIVKAKRNEDSCISATWLGYVVNNVLNMNVLDISCRGEFFLGDVANCPYDDDKLILEVSAYTAWSPCIELFDQLAEMYDCNLFWVAEELGCELFQGNDSTGRYFNDTIIVYTESNGTEYFTSQEDALKYIQESAGDENLTWHKAKCLDDYYIYEIDYV